MSPTTLALMSEFDVSRLACQHIFGYINYEFPEWGYCTLWLHEDTS